MVGEILTAGDLGRLPAYGSNAPTTGRIPMYDSATKKATYVTADQIASGANAVDGPSSATDNAIARFDGTTGKLIQNSAATIDDTTGAITITGTGAATITKTTNQIVLGTTNTTTVNATAPAASITTNLPTVSGAIATTTGSNLYYVDAKRCTAQVDATTTTLANVTGLSFTVVPGTYIFNGAIDTTCGGTGGVKLAFNYTTTVLSAINANAAAFTASAIATSKTTTTTTQTSIVASNTAFTQVQLTGTMVVTTGGTVDLQFAENSANSTSSVLVGSYLQFIRIA